jgi:protease-4
MRADAAACAAAPADMSDPEGEALFAVLQSGKPVAPEDVPDIFAPAERACPRASRQDGAPGGASPGLPQTPQGPASEGRRRDDAACEERIWQASGEDVGDAGRTPPINPRWGGAAGTGRVHAAGGAGTPPGGAGGAWVWLPEGMKPPKSWRKRHPVLFWGGCLLVLATVFGWGRMSVEDGPLNAPKIAVINLEGIILDASAELQWIEKVRLDPSIKGALLRVNSPGGAVGPSQEIYAAIKRLDADKPVFASMGALAASGGYYACLGAREIHAGPSSLTASIGVKMQVPNFEALMKTIGVAETTLTTGKLKDAGSSWRPMTPEEEVHLSSLLQDMYEEFIRTVARERALPPDVVRQLADGRAMTGRQALEAKLVDHLGDRHETLERLKEQCLLSGPVKIVEGPEKPGSLLKELMSGLLHMGMEHTLALEQPVFLY